MQMKLTLLIAVVIWNNVLLAQRCEVLLSGASFDHDTCYLIRNKTEQYFVVNGYKDKVYRNGRLIYTFSKQILMYETFQFFRVGTNNVLYIFPQYVGQLGPYVWKNTQGVLLLTRQGAPLCTVRADLPFIEQEELCDSLIRYVE